MTQLSRSQRTPSQNFAEHLMPLVLSERVSMLELQNSVLKKTARERSERIIELERELYLGSVSAGLERPRQSPISSRWLPFRTI